MSPMEFVSAEKTKDGAAFLFKNATPVEASEILRAYLFREKYRLEDGTALQGVYGTGSAIGRAIAGAFVKRYKFRVDITPQQGLTRIEFSKGMSGAMGGVIGYRKMSKEFDRLVDAIKMLT